MWLVFYRWFQLSQDLINVIREVTMRDNVDEAFLGEYFIHRISECVAGVKRFEEKYGMLFEEYEERAWFRH